jgi:hypothetical protein
MFSETARHSRQCLPQLAPILRDNPPRFQLQHRSMSPLRRCIVAATTRAHNIHMQQVVASNTHAEKQQQKTRTPSNRTAELRP